MYIFIFNISSNFIVLMHMIIKKNSHFFIYFQVITTYYFIFIHLIPELYVFISFIFHFRMKIVNSLYLAMHVI